MTSTPYAKPHPTGDCDASPDDAHAARPISAVLGIVFALTNRTLRRTVVLVRAAGTVLPLLLLA